MDLSSRHVSTTLTAEIRRADGSIEYLGTIGYWHKNPFRRLGWRAACIIRKLKEKL
jgi:hypothetical protein